MVSTAVALAVGALLLFGAWAVTGALATRSLSVVNAVFLSYVASLVIAGGYVMATKKPITGTRVDAAFAVASGVCLAAGTIAFYAALSRGSMAIVSAIAALYFVVPVAVDALVFDTPLSTSNLAGLGLAVVAVVLIAS